MNDDCLLYSKIYGFEKHCYNRCSNLSSKESAPLVVEEEDLLFNEVKNSQDLIEKVFRASNLKVAARIKAKGDAKIASAAGIDDGGGDGCGTTTARRRANESDCVGSVRMVTGCGRYSGLGFIGSWVVAVNMAKRRRKIVAEPLAICSIAR
ncbi:hypothetical protein ACFE04_017552 [Oxalis oulophora]